MYLMLSRLSSALLLVSILAYGCSRPGSPKPVQLKYKAAGNSPEILAQYEAWFGMPEHISVGYSSQDADVIRGQIQKAKAMGISGFVVGWYGDRQPFIDKSYAQMQTIAAKRNFRVAMMYIETSQDDGATDEAVADLTMFHDTYLLSKSPGHSGYLTYQGHPVIFIFPSGGHTDWDTVRNVVSKWKPAPLLIGKAPPARYADAFDGFYPWINPGPKGWTADGSHWGRQSLVDFYQTMGSKYPDKVIVGGAWSGFNDSKASWSLNRHMSARCGQTYQDTFNLCRKYFPANQIIPFVMIDTWNDYEEGSDIEPGIPTCGNASQQGSPKGEGASSKAPSAKR